MLTKIKSINQLNLKIMKYISFEHGSHVARFKNPITGEKTYVGNFWTEKEAIDLLSTVEIAFYVKHPELLPKGVTVFKNDCFVLTISIPHYSKSKKVHLGSFKLIEQCKERKLDIISKLID